jgi:NTE family protein
MNEAPKSTALILTGGGARAAYQVGVLKALAEWLPEDSPCPFPIIVGTSAGAVAAVALAGRSGRFRAAVNALEQVWANFHVEQVFRADTVSMLRAGVHWLLAFVSSGLLLPPPKSLFDNSPLRELLSHTMSAACIARWPREGSGPSASVPRASALDVA